MCMRYCSLRINMCLMGYGIRNNLRLMSNTYFLVKHLILYLLLRLQISILLLKIQYLLIKLPLLSFKLSFNSMLLSFELPGLLFDLLLLSCLLLLVFRNNLLYKSLLLLLMDYLIDRFLFFYNWIVSLLLFSFCII